MRALVIGGSIGGLFAALFLRLRGFDVEVYERAEPELAGRGAGISTHPRTLALLAALDLGLTDFGISLRKRRVFDRDGRVVAERDYPQIMTSWDRLFALLMSGLPSAHYHRGKELARIEERSGEVIAHFADGSAAAGDLLIGADGFRSTVRRLLLPDCAMAYVGYIAWRALIAEDEIAPPLRHDLFESMDFCLPPGEQFLGYPVAGAGNDLRPGHRRYNIVWYRPADTPALARLLTDETGETHDLSIPPPRIARAVVDEMRAAAESKLAPQFQEVMRRAAHPFLQPIYDLEVPRMVVGRVALTGDAAFVARPHIGAGVTKAGGDAQALASALAAGQDVARALARFASERMPAGHSMVAQARRLGAAMQARLATAEEQAMAARYRDPQTVLQDTASLDFLGQ